MIIDSTRLLQRTLKGRLPTGVDRVSLAYIDRFRDKAKALLIMGKKWFVFDKESSANLYENLLSPKSRTFLAITVGKGLLSGGAPAQGETLLNVGHMGLERAGYTAKAKSLGLKPYYFLHDLIPITHPEYSKAGEPDLHRNRMAEMMQSDGLILNSAATQTVLDRYAAQIGAKAPRCVAAPIAPAHLPPPSHNRPEENPYFVILGTIEPRKNHLTILHAWRRIVEEKGPKAPKLFVIGQRGWDCEQIADLLDRCAQLRGTVTELPRCSDAELSTYLHHAQALLFPSFEEGYGMPLVEALAAGTAVIASTLPVFREIAGDIPDYLDPLDGCGWLNAILAYASPESEARAQQCDRLQNFEVPTWKSHFAKVEAFFPNEP